MEQKIGIFLMINTCLGGEMVNTVKPRGTDSAKVISVIETKAVRSDGTANAPCRLVTQYWDFKGNLLAERDVCTKEKE